MMDGLTHFVIGFVCEGHKKGKAFPICGGSKTPHRDGNATILLLLLYLDVVGAGR